MIWQRATSPVEGKAAHTDTTTQDAASSRAAASQVIAVEDDPADRRLIEDALISYPAPIDATIVGDGERAIEALSDPSTSFDLMLLDLHLPGRDGRDVLAHVRARHGPTQLPVVVLSSLASDTDALRCYELGANAVVAKAFDLDGFRDVVHRILAYWLGVVSSSADPA